MTDQATEIDAEIDEPHRRPRRSRLLWLGLGVLAVAGAGTGYWYTTQDEAADATSQEADRAVATAEVGRDTISDTRSFDGTLGHGEAFTVVTAGQGVITGIVDQGTEVERGTELFRLDQQPVVALHGAVPMYRDLRPGAVGADVEQLISNLTELGYADCEAEDEFTWCVEVAVQEWQEDIGADETGLVAQTDVVFVADGGRVDTIHTGVGGVVSQGSPVLDLTGSDHIVSLDVDVRDRDLLAVDTAVAVRLPGGDEVDGQVSAANVVPTGSGGDGSEGSEDAVARVEITLDEAVDEALLGSPADVIIEVDERVDVLTVPVIALLALPGGGHGVEVVADDGTTDLVPVETGLFAGGHVEVTGDGIDEGTVVQVAGR
ncbi:efflux RND transporter periplasmic adaptor subunit [Phytoactinopolyspora mesophila]|uniref:Efflux RND transporter periplasmic adaptor subunit n=1 Tax=Phytoactinopolyspora mesophila TaxID=2650750 RepID=A0A7K3M7B1_9ACTN|nr:efflux RND transporter periplasmic adaptor subunit [Phytoactinopolyspora mesophila]NDL58298.1 efflux RND transporter periplasmic adaptor subunit [Phytoactinopolyspora mesophila]